MVVIVCQTCLLPTKSYSFDERSLPICFNCQEKILMKNIVEVKEKELSFVWTDGKQCELEKWLR